MNELYLFPRAKNYLKCFLMCAVLFCSATMNANVPGSCGVIYVSPGGNSSGAGTPASPVDLATALSNVGSANLIRMQGGTYVYSPSSTLIVPPNCIIDGGYDNSWLKNSSQITNMIITAPVTNVSGTGQAIGLVINGDNVVLQDLTITVNAASGSFNNFGVTVYAVYVANYSNWQINRCIITSGNGGNGSNGTDGGAGNGGAGGAGGEGGYGANSSEPTTSPSYNGDASHTHDCGAYGNDGLNGNSSSAGSGTGTGTTAGSNVNGGGGGGGGSISGGYNNFLGCCDWNSGSGSNGNGGSTGGNASETWGSTPATAPAPGQYFIPVQAASGAGGAGGGGGGGGGSGADGTHCGGCSANGFWNGGTGGTGGTGGAGGTGGYGGGGSFAVYAYNAIGTLNNSTLTSGTPGTGGNGGAGVGGAGGGGGAQGATATGSCSPQAQGGNGGNGGTGGAGAQGQYGHNGVAQSLETVSSTVANNNAGSQPDPTDVTVNYGSSSVTPRTEGCTNSEIAIASAGGTFSDWVLPAGATLENDETPTTSSYTSTSTSINVCFSSTTSGSNLGTGPGAANTYVGYLKVQGTGSLPNISSPGNNDSACAGGKVIFTTPDNSLDAYQWAEDKTNCDLPYHSGTSQSDTASFTSLGTWYARLRERTACCGWSCPSYVTFYVVTPPVISTQPVSQVACTSSGPSALTFGVSGGAGTWTYQWYSNSINSTVGGAPLSGTNSPTYTPANTVGTTYYFAVATQSGIGCGSLTSNVVSVEIDPATVAGSVIGGTSPTCLGTSPGTLTLTGYNGDILYWTADSTNIPDSTDTYTPQPINIPGSYTYTATVKSGSCPAIVSAARTIVVNQLVSPYLLTGGGAYCSGSAGRSIGLDGSSVGLSYSLYLGSTLVAGPTPGTGAPISFGVYTQPGTYSATATNSIGCQSVVNNTVTITQLSLPVISGVTSSDVTCYGMAGGDSITIDATSANGALSYSIDSGNAYVSNGGVFTPATAADYFIFVRDDSSCITAYAANPVVISQPTARLVVTDIANDITCHNANDGSISLQPSGGWGAYTYSWSSGQTTQVISGLPAAIYTGSVTDMKGCVVSIIDTVTNPTVISESVVSASVTCAGASNGSASVIVSGGTPPYSYLWSNFSTDSAQTGLPGGTYYIIVTDARGCVGRDSAIVNEGLPLVVSDSVGQTSCGGANNSSIHISVSGGALPYIYTWSPAGQNLPDTTNIASGTYDVTVTDHNGCSASVSVIVNNFAPLTTAVVVTDPTCNGSGNGDISVIAGGGTTPYTYNWQGGISTSSEASFLMAGTYHVTVTDAHGCSVSDTVLVSQPSPMYVSGIAKNVSCHDYSDGQILPTAYGGTLPYSYQWYLGTDTFAPLGPITQNIIQLSGGYYFLVVTDANGCQVTFSRDIINPDSLEISLVKTDATCQSANSGAVAVVVTGGTVPYQFLWNNFVTDSSQVNIPGGTYGVVVTDSNGCHQNESIVVNGQPSPMSVNVSVSSPTCSTGTGGFITLDVQGGAPPYLYNWSTSPAQTGSVATDLSGGTYTCTITDTKGCEVIDTAALTAPTPITVSIGTGMTSCVSSADGNAVVNVSGGVPPYVYQMGSTIQTTDTFTHLAVGSYTLLVTDANGCQGSTTLTITSAGSLSSTLTAIPDYILAHQQVQLEVAATSDTTIIAYIWNPLDSLNFSGCADTSDCFDPTATPSATHVYVVTVENARGCTVTDTVLVNVSPTSYIFIPTAFAPQGNVQANQLFNYHILGATSAHVQIWNRLGDKVFDNPAQKNDNDANAWNGKYNNTGDLMTFDTYTYQFVVTYSDSHQETISGTVVLMR